MRLGAAIDRGHLEAAQLLLARGATIGATSADRTRMLLAAARSNSVDVLNLVLSEGAEINAATPEGYTALLWAASWSTAPMVQALLERGAEMDAVGPGGDTALRRARLWGNSVSVSLLRAAGARETPPSFANQIIDGCRILEIRLERCRGKAVSILISRVKNALEPRPADPW